MMPIRSYALLIIFSAVALGGSNCHVESGGGDTGALDVRIAGLPTNLAAPVTVTGVGTNVSVPSSRTLVNLAPGRYTITAGDVLNGQSALRPNPPSQNAQVSPGQTTVVTVTYNIAGPLSLQLQQVVSNSALASPIFLASPPGDPRLFIADRGGRIWIVKNGVRLAAPFLDISGRVTQVSGTDERGFLSFAFHPQYAQNRFIFVHYTSVNFGDIVVERFQASATNPDVADAGSTPVITVAHRSATNHNGGRVGFDAGGFLLLSTGDGGGAGDPQQNAQNPARVLGKMLRIDVRTLPYTIPTNNPFGNEVWAIGLRNPWRWSIDATTNLLYIGDVGQNAFEEVDVADAARPGLNYGWSITEGNACFNPPSGCNKVGQVPPVLEYDHLSGACSITGGYVYRGSAIPELQGHYFYSDACAGFLRSFRLANGQALEQVDWNISSVGPIFSFGEDANRELYVITPSNGVLRIVRQ